MKYPQTVTRQLPTNPTPCRKIRLSGALVKIMRRVLRKVAAGELDNLGDTSTLADPSVVQNIIEHRAVDKG